jgi:serine/threonine protein kinase
MAVNDNTRPPAALPPGTRLDEFELRRVLGIGGFGIVYLAIDHALEREVAIKEYMPSTLVGRSGDGTRLSLLSEEHANSFSLGLRSFVNEARLLARFDAPGLVKVHRYWEANNTAYMAMPYYSGGNLHAVRRRMGTPPDEAWLRGILQPLLDALERLHREGIYHRDISPDNVILQPDGQPVLLDFGAARRVISDKSMALTAILKPAYAPIEQYAEMAAVKQGAWTDLYALGATLHFLLLGQAPPPATARAVEDQMPPLAGQAALLARCSSGFLQAVDWMLRPRPADRPQTVAALRQALLPRDDPAAERTILDLSHLPPSPRAGRPQQDDATVLLPRRDEPTVLIPRKPAPAAPPPVPVRDEPTILMPRRDEATVLMPRQEEVSLLLPLDGAPAVHARPAFQDAQEPTMRMPPRGAAKAPPLHAQRPLPMPRPPSRRKPLLVVGVVLALAGVGLAAWLALRSAGAPPASAPAKPPASAEQPVPAAPAEAPSRPVASTGNAGLSQARETKSMV